MGAFDMAKNYMDMREANFKNSDKYFHAKANYEAAKRGPGGEAASRHISAAREWFSSDAADSAADHEANNWGRAGNDPNKYRPEGLPDKY